MYTIVYIRLYIGKYLYFLCFILQSIGCKNLIFTSGVFQHGYFLHFNNNNSSSFIVISTLAKLKRIIFYYYFFVSIELKFPFSSYISISVPCQAFLRYKNNIRRLAVSSLSTHIKVTGILTAVYASLYGGVVHMMYRI